MFGPFTFAKNDHWRQRRVGGIFGQIIGVFGHSAQLNIAAMARASQAVTGEMLLGRLTVHFSMTNWQSLRDMEHFALLHGLGLVVVI